jgi:hypothetical protein
MIHGNSEFGWQFMVGFNEAARMRFISRITVSARRHGRRILRGIRMCQKKIKLQGTWTKKTIQRLTSSKQQSLLQNIISKPIMVVFIEHALLHRQSSFTTCAQLSTLVTVGGSGCG